jgi:hypothetical protein
MIQIKIDGRIHNAADLHLSSFANPARFAAQK